MGPATASNTASSTATSVGRGGLESVHSDGNRAGGTWDTANGGGRVIVDTACGVAQGVFAPGGHVECSEAIQKAHAKYRSWRRDKLSRRHNLGNIGGRGRGGDGGVVVSGWDIIGGSGGRSTRSSGAGGGNGSSAGGGESDGGDR